MTTTEKKSKTAVSKSAEKHLKIALKKVRTLLVKAERNDVKARYDIACIVLKVKSDAKFGSGAINRLEELLGLDRSSLYRLAAVAEVWPKAEFMAESKTSNQAGLALSWSHWEVLAYDVKDGRLRNGLLTRCREENLSVRELKLAAKAGDEQATERGQSVKDAAPLEGADLVEEARRCVSTIEESIASWSKDLLADVLRSRETLSETNRADLMASAEQMNGLAESLWELSKHLQEALDETPPMLAEVHELKAAAPTAL